MYFHHSCQLLFQYDQIDPILKRDDLLHPKEKKDCEAVPLVIDYHPNLKDFGSLVRRLFQQLDSITKNVFKVSPFVAFRSPKNIRSHLVRAKVPLNNGRVNKCSKCNDVRCKVCDNLNESETFTSTVNGSSYFINQKLNCSSINVVYLITCKVCKIQYVGQTCGKFRLRWNNYKTCQDKARQGHKVPQLSFHKHFLSQGHSGLLNDAEVKLIDKTDPFSPTEREDFWIAKLGTHYPAGLNF